MQVQLKPQRKNPERTSVYINGKYSFSVDKETLLRLNLFEQTEIPASFLDTLSYEAEKKKARDYVFHLLSYRMRSKKELEDSLRRRAYSLAIIKDIMSELETLNLIDDKKFAEAFAQDRLNFALKGKRIIFAELLKRGLDNQTIKTTLAEIDESKEETACLKLIRKFSGRYKNLSEYEKKQKLYGLLTRHGFSYSIIKKALKIEEENGTTDATD